MGDATISRFPGNLDPRAQEFIPGALHVVQPPYPDATYYPYQAPLPPFSLAPSPAYVSADPSSFLRSVCLAPPLPPPTTTTTTRSMPSRALLLSMVPPGVSESTVRRELEVFGDVRAVQMERVRDGIVTVHFYDLRQAQQALEEIQEQHMQQQFRLKRHYDAAVLAAAHHHHTSSLNLSLLLRSPPPLVPPPPVPPPAHGLIAGRAVWAQFTVPATSTIPDGTNQGTLVIFNLEPEVTPSILTQIFQAFGHVKELRETPRKRHQRFVEFYDVRDAAKALMEMNGKEIQGRNVVIEFSRPGGGYGGGKKCSSISKTSNYPAGRVAAAAACSTQITPDQQSHLPPALPLSKPYGHWLSCTSDESSCYYLKGGGNPNGKNGEMSRSSSNSSRASLTNSMGPLKLLENDSKSAAVMTVCGFSKKKAVKKRGGGNNILTINGGASTASSSTSNSKQQQKNRSRGGGSCRPWKGSSRQSKEYDPRFLINEDAIIEANSRDSRTTVMIKNIPNKYSQKLLLNMLDNHCIHCNEQIGDGNNQPFSSYDFVYLPIDFVNKCNVGYGFVNMTSPEATLRLYKAFHRQSWEVFNSRKICEVTYARLQGVEALKEHFKNSKFPYDIDEYMPVIFFPPRDGRQLTEPVSITGRFAAATTASSPENLQFFNNSSSSPAVSCSKEVEADYYYSDESLLLINGHEDDNGADNGEDEDDVYSSSGGGRSSSNGGVSGECDDSTDDV